MDRYEEDLLYRVLGGIAQITGLGQEDLQPRQDDFIPVQPYSLDLGAIAGSGKKKEVIDFLKEWLGWLTTNIEGSQYFHGKHIPYEDYYDEDCEYESHFETWDDMPRRLQKYILSLKVRDWVAKLIPDLTAAVATPGHVPPAESTKSGTTSQKVLAMYYIFESLKLSSEIDATKKAKFTQFLTGGGWKNIYDATCKPFKKENGDDKVQDMRKVRDLFESLHLFDIAEMINNDLKGAN